MTLVRAITAWNSRSVARTLKLFNKLEHSNRSIVSTAVRNKWLSGKDAEGPNIPVGTSGGSQDDPIMNTTDRHWVGDPGDPPIKEWYYREPPPQFVTGFDKMMLTVMSTILWCWVTYHIYYNYKELIGGEFYAPLPEEFTDEELGIPPDDAPDPEYWGDHYLSRNMKL